MPGLLSRLLRRPAAPVRWMEVGELRRQLAGDTPPLILDVRGADEFEGPLGHIDGARNIPLPTLGAHQAGIATAGRAVVCVCLTDKRSAAAAAELTKAGLADVAVLRGGMTAWRQR